MRAVLVPWLGVLFLVGCTGKYIRPTTQETFTATPERLARGEYLVNQAAACGACHSYREGGTLVGGESAAEYLAGGVMLQEGSMAVYVPNITPDAETGIGAWTDDELARAIRDGVGRDGKFLFPLMPAASYRYISDEDVKAIVAYLRSVPKVKQTRPRPENQLPFFAKAAIGMGMAAHEPARDVPPPKDDPVSRGEYVSRLGHCWTCHSLKSRGPRVEGDAEFFGGSDNPMVLPGYSKAWAPNLTRDEQTGLGRYGKDAFKKALRAGRRLDGKRMASPMSLLVPHVSGLTDADLDALAEYLWSLPPVNKKVPERELTEEGKKLWEDAPAAQSAR